MPVYRSPLRDQQFVIHELLDATAHYRDIPAYAEVDADTINQVLEESGRFCAEVLFPLNAVGDAEGCHYDKANHEVRTPTGFKAAWGQYREAGWNGLGADTAYGGQGLPALMQTAVGEMQNSANQAWAMYPGLSTGAYECLHEHGTPEQKALYLPKLVSGEWTGTMCLTEPHCGTDLGLIKTRAVPRDDGSYAITGTKIFISAGEHDLADNIIHLVLAKLPDAPEGSRGISLFIVPKFVPQADGSVGARNGIFCGGIEHKMGIHGNSTCQMIMEDAVGYLVSEPNKGLNAMFVMMNGARLGVGMQGLGLTEVAYQNAVAYAKDRVQGRALKGAAEPDKPADSILVHPDVRRMLLTARAYAEGGRALGYWTGLQLDVARSHPDEAKRREALAQVGLLTPIVKAFLTDNGFRAAVEGQQVFGGHGFIHETGVEQYVRDARINMIYEGTNGIQALDLLGRKVLRDNGAALRAFGAQIQAFVEAEGTSEAMNEFVTPLADLGDKFTKMTMELGMKAMGNADEVGAAATDYLRVAGHLVFAYLWARMARLALDKQDDPFYAAKLATARFYFARLLPEATAHMRALRAGAKSIDGMDLAWF
ncbi:acyl-CoA dehydrogenase C-terminal domain-containing protein [Achromobacter sp. GG226]|uniref:acyl-CoA dehydrogenase C-terminal domain-containing protein n=1 Tax=Verticiella alkaliphila TaxID=2779529 RepID=UPI001C0B6D54|nr:acyl-CoA dehydrogenase C-terminal domain-containing protein [Verticiella sp. GG226]MBU4611997.1 acyl-CoA dehydrogenase C-terminal domain-containing protein [Verticiella sp. GG226]